MPDSMAVGAIALIAGILGLIAGYVVRRLLTATKIRNAESYAERLVADARAKQKEIILEGKDEVLQVQRAAEEEARQRRTDLQRQDRLLLDRTEGLDRKSESLERREVQAEERVAELDAEKVRLAALRAQQLTSLEHIGGLSASEARQSLIRAIEDEAQAEAAHRVREIERHATEDGEERSRRILTTVMQRIAADHTSEATVTVVHLPNDEMKGRIIGREGRNIR
ncbi:MAG TPA: Rnase Y domain-containing protein, partial [Candidatus Limnocylindria bacterium]